MSCSAESQAGPGPRLLGKAQPQGEGSAGLATVQHPPGQGRHRPGLPSPGEAGLPEAGGGDWRPLAGMSEAHTDPHTAPPPPKASETQCKDTGAKRDLGPWAGGSLRLTRRGGHTPSPRLGCGEGARRCLGRQKGSHRAGHRATSGCHRGLCREGRTTGAVWRDVPRTCAQPGPRRPQPDQLQETAAPSTALAGPTWPCLLPLRGGHSSLWCHLACSVAWSATQCVSPEVPGTVPAMSLES